MDKKKATLTLTEKLNELGYINLVSDPAIKSHLLDNAKSVVFDTQKTGRIRTVGTENASPARFFERERIKRDDLPYCLKGDKEANYFFIEDHNSLYKLVTPVAIIGRTEEEVLRENFYKNVPEKILKAFEVLKILNFIDAYSIYSSLKWGEFLILRFGIYRLFEKEDRTELGDIIQGSKSGRYYLVDKIKSDGSVEGYRFQDEALEIPVEGKGDDMKYDECESSCIIPVKKRLFDINFFDFVFSLPYEDQNIEVNKTIIKNLSNVDSCDILRQEYSQGEHFKDYFLILDEECKKKVIEEIKSLPKQDYFLNSWLFSQGFDVKMDYLELYKKDAKGFINYFKRSSKDVQELIVSDLFNCDHINDEVIAFLEKEYSNLLRDVSFKKEVIKGGGEG